MVSKEKAAEIKKDQTDCMGCLSQCKFSSWKDSDKYSTGKLVDPRSFVYKKLYKMLLMTTKLIMN